MDDFKDRIGVGRRSMIGRRAGGPGRTKTDAVPRDEAPGVAGSKTEHWDGRVDAKVVGPEITVNPNLIVRQQ